MQQQQSPSPKEPSPPSSVARRRLQEAPSTTEVTGGPGTEAMREIEDIRRKIETLKAAEAARQARATEGPQHSPAAGHESTRPSPGAGGRQPRSPQQQDHDASSLAGSGVPSGPEPAGWRQTMRHGRSPMQAEGGWGSSLAPSQPMEEDEQPPQPYPSTSPAPPRYETMTTSHGANAPEPTATHGPQVSRGSADSATVPPAVDPSQTMADMRGRLPAPLLDPNDSLGGLGFGPGAFAAGPSVDMGALSELLRKEVRSAVWEAMSSIREEIQRDIRQEIEGVHVDLIRQNIELSQQITLLAQRQEVIARMVESATHRAKNALGKSI